MNAGTKRNLPGDPARDVKLVGPLPAALVTIGQGDQQQDLLIGSFWRKAAVWRWSPIRIISGYETDSIEAAS
jgi:hypothetical protein